MPFLPRATAPSRLTTVAILAAMAAMLLAALAPINSTQAAPVTAGFKDHSYGPGVNAPTEDKPQSKVWFMDGSWWAGMFVGGEDTEYRIHRYNASTHVWADTGVVVDGRNSSHGDYLWDAASNSLYVASVNGDNDPDPILVFKLTYNPSTDTWAHDPDFTAAGITVGTGPSETVTIAKDSTGQLWVTFQNAVDPTGVTTTNRNIMVNRSLADEHTWGAAFDIGEAGEDDISAIIAFGGNSVGVMWSDQNPSEAQTFFYFSTHADSADDEDWSTKQSSAQGTDDFAEDHVNLKLAATDSGQVLAAVKTDDGPDHIQLLSRNASTGNWAEHVVVGGEQDVTRPQLVVDETEDRVYVLYTSPRDPGSGQAIYYKSAPLSSLSFTTSGLGTLFIDDGANDINDISTSKHNVTAATGLVAIASSDTNDSYYHGYLALGPSHPFTDISGHAFENEIIWLYNEGITKGCSATTFCPDGVVTRQQMASFLVRALDLPSTTEDYFTDDTGSRHELDINALAESGITKGCSATTFCPTAAVTRQQMASFLVRGFDLPPTAVDYFTDDTGSRHELDINALAESGITKGCSATTFCPLQTVTRGQMAAFLFRAMES
ncbi:MAG: S-layer homology domain-containing protein [Chloroflexota bacterium]|nr:S-layer homology domain-containing protein [Chloroflexota bacterium]